MSFLTLQQHEILQHYSLTTYSVSFTQCINFKVAMGYYMYESWTHGIQPYFLHTVHQLQSGLLCMSAWIHGIQPYFLHIVHQLDPELDYSSNVWVHAFID